MIPSSRQPTLPVIPKDEAICISFQSACVRGLASTNRQPLSSLASQTSAAILADYLGQLMNRERVNRALQPLQPSAFLASLAQKHAALMASTRTVKHSVTSIGELEFILGSPSGENVLEGTSLDSIHRDNMTRGSVTRTNVLGSSFTQYGFGIAFGPNGKLYFCQLFRKVRRKVKY